MNTFLISAILIVYLSILGDLIFGEPPNRWHPVIFIGKLIGIIETLTPRGNKIIEFVFGMFIVSIPTVILIFSFSLTTALIRTSLGIGFWIISNIILYSTMFAIKSMTEHVVPILDSMQENDLIQSRMRTALIVGRSTSELTLPLLRSAVIESISENTVESSLSSFFIFGLFVLPGAIFFKVINTADAMVGYKIKKYKQIGFIAAKLDDILNWIPARLSVLFISLSFGLLSKDWKGSIGVSKKYGNNTDSPNSGYPMAGGLSISLKKVGYYHLGDDELPNSIQEIRPALVVSIITSILFASCITIPLFFIFGISVQLFFENILYTSIF